MKTFTVIVTRDVTESVVLTIEAASSEEASDRALFLVDTDLDQDWEVDDGSNYRTPYVTDVTEEPTDLAVRHEREQEELTDEA